ncbi:putative membrane protein [Bacillus phage AR9]|uniref:Uncharacterized protein n=2 Tax=Bacillus phage PBS1 TaxID=10683 RepID=A0A223LCV8_BPPB1|nr:hypothetical protein BI022_gp172 [Bacillus phage AR9]YP_009664263.1 hypothetical protein FK780_gp061 [Bacillus phage PBS1]QXN70095.1 putative membrane protein [Bacillus phage vB_BspM_Internexus]WCS68296.1 hypothetical protein Goe21_01860 [Bacillus phage vB_BsuM-Goe21]AMS01257.1 putative membrane protein [Bacillus phage AR9]AST99883.1 hypothetical protein PBI_PBS1_61 [Bacillus phage PBS1]BDE75297.1 hypothetical protein [Bacillus phage PBS1]
MDIYESFCFSLLGFGLAIAVVCVTLSVILVLNTNILIKRQIEKLEDKIND